MIFLSEEKQSEIIEVSARRLDIWTVYYILTMTTSMV